MSMCLLIFFDIHRSFWLLFFSPFSFFLFFYRFIFIYTHNFFFRIYLFIHISLACRNAKWWNINRNHWMRDYKWRKQKQKKKNERKKNCNRKWKMSIIISVKWFVNVCVCMWWRASLFFFLLVVVDGFCFFNSSIHVRFDKICDYAVAMRIKWEKNSYVHIESIDGWRNCSSNKKQTHEKEWNQ